MKIFEKRPLAIILCVMLGGFSFFADFDWKTKLILASIPLLLIGLIYIFDNLKFGRKPIVIISLTALGVSFILSSLWSLIFYPASYYDKNVTLTARIYEIDNSKPTSSILLCKTEEIDGKKDRHNFIFHMDKNAATALREYDIISITATVRALPDYDDGFDGKSYYISKGISATLDEIKSIDIEDNIPDRFNTFFKGLQLKISNKLKLRTNFETGAFLSALIVGNRTDLNGNTKLNFARLGISHILALSGMHLAILSLAINTILKRLEVKKKPRLLIMILLVAFYVALTGFSASVLRSGLMLIISSILFLLSNKADALTSLAISVFVIVAFNPTSVFDLSLWLSAFATLGVIVYSEIAEKSNTNMNFIEKLWTSFKNGCLISVFAFCATFAFTALRFDSFSVVSIITTLIFSFIIQFFIYSGLLLLLIGGIIPLGKIIIFISEIILWLAEFISSFKFVYVSMNSVVLKLLVVILSVFFFAFLVFEIKNKKKGILIIILLLATVFTCAEIDTLASRYDNDLIYSPSFSGDIMLLKSKGEVSAIYSGRAVSSGSWDILDCFTNEKLTYIDNFVFASYSHSTMQFANIIIDGIKVDKILLPRPTTDEELGQAEGLSYLLSKYGTRLEFYNMLEYINLGEYRYRLFEKAHYTYGITVQNVYEVVYNNSRITYLTPHKYSELSPSAKHLLNKTENLIIGTMGDSNQYSFQTMLPELKNIYYYNDQILSDNAKENYEKRGASMHCIKTPLSIFD